ncbi:prohibitin family protein [Listeria newyorkensis]|uniref:prohibitin family protein n=1 Tax=Listeria newyorkensis TaxID=1497681 RepID=UPI00051D3AEC|nr:prohibitin family protein [Listeria newyorkensis]KGL44109.1 hypothetical protein EP58_06580 [Listeria newyorkensis]SQC57660.1 SPFH domain / Band 7 family [Listeria newyorkensis]
MKKSVIGAIAIGVLLIFGAIGLIMSLTKVDNGNVGIVYSPNGGIKEKALGQGWHMVGLLDKVNEYPTKLRTVDAKDLTVSTKDGKNINLDLSYSYKIDASKATDIYKTFGSVPVEELEKGYMERRLLETTRRVVSKYNLLDIYGEDATEASMNIQKDFAKNVDKLGFIVSDTTLGAPKADAKTQAAIDDRVKVSQENSKKKLELENDKIDAQRKEVQAQGEATKRQIEATAEAKANETVSKSITTELLRKMEMEARIQHGWITTQGANTVVTDGK